MQSRRIGLVVTTVCCLVTALALLTPSHLGLPNLGRVLNIVRDQESQSQAENAKEPDNKATNADSPPAPPFSSPQLEEESRRQRIQSSTEDSMPAPPSFTPPTSTSSTTSSTIPFGCSVRVIQTNSVMPIYYRVEIFSEGGRSVSAKVSHDDEVEVFDIAIINQRGTVLVKSFSRKTPTVEVFSKDSDMRTQLGCRT